MIYVALVALLVPVVVVVAAARLIQSLVRQHARERALLINQICALSGKPWEPAPAQTWEPPSEPGPTLYASPEQMTADDLDPVI